MAGEIAGGFRHLLDRRAFLQRGNVARQENAEGRAGGIGAVAEHISPGLFDDAIDHGQAEAGALAHLLRREEGLEYLLLHISGYAVAIVLDFNQHIVGRRQRFFVEGRAFRRLDIARAQMNLAALGHGVARIHHEIDDHLLELIDVSFDQPEITPVFQIKRDFLAHQTPHQHLQVR